MIWSSSHILARNISQGSKIDWKAIWNYEIECMSLTICHSIFLPGSVLGPILFNIFIKNIDSGTECTFSKFEDDTKAEWCSWFTGGKVCHPEEPWQTWEKDTCKPLEVQHGLLVSWGNPQYQYRLGAEWIGSIPKQKGLGFRQMKYSTWEANVLLRPRKPSMPWAASKLMWLSGRERGICPSALVP